MIKNVDDVVLAISQGRIKEYLHSNIELKENWDQKHGDKLSALANKTDQLSSFLVVGVRDDGSLADRVESWAKKTEEVLSQHINQNLDPIQTCRAVSCREIHGKWVVIVSIQNPGEVVYWGDHAHCASGTTSKRMNPDEVLKLRIQLPGLTDYSMQTHRSRYDEELVRRFAGEVAKKQHPLEVTDDDLRDPITVLKTLGLYERQAARLLFGKTVYRIVRYNANDEPTSNKKCEGLFSLLLPDFISNLCHEGDNHFSDRALKEALSNAVAHAAYYENDGEIALEIYPHRIAVSNLCVKESAYFANRWFSRSHKTVNGLLMEALRVAGFVDELGRGKNIIFSESIRTGRRPPEVHIEKSGKYQRWKLFIYGGQQDQKLLRLLERCREIFHDERKALIALALVFWTDRKVSEIQNYVDGDFARQFAEVLSSGQGPIFYFKEEDRILQRRWARVLLSEGKDSKDLSPGEEERLKLIAYDIQRKYHDGIITPARLRNLAAMGETTSERSLSSSILARWVKQGIVTKDGRGKFKFVTKVQNVEDINDFLNLFDKSS